MDDGVQRKRQGLLQVIARLLSRRKPITEEELHEMMNAGEEEGIINEEENEMIRSILDFKHSVVREIMVPRTDMAAIASDATVREVIDAINACGHSRLPLYEGSIDNIVGLIYAKDLLRAWGEADAAIDLRQIMRPPFFVPESKELEELLAEFKRRRVHIAIVIDEYGGTSGLVTIEDLLEQIVGDIQDEYDLEEEWLLEQPDGSLLVDGRLSIEELEEYFSIQIPRDKFDTVGGLIIFLTGRIARVGDTVEGSGLRFTVVEADQRKISRVRVERLTLSMGEVV
ncbi:MAG TPA: hemolysin family protein [Geobacterales bacterium]|nr:hemolysin family protein [Geobacterales bacterium]